MTPNDFDRTLRAALARIAHHERLAAQWRRLLATLAPERTNGHPELGHPLTGHREGDSAINRRDKQGQERP